MVLLVSMVTIKFFLCGNQYHRGCILMHWYLNLPFVPMYSPLALRGYPSRWIRIHCQIPYRIFAYTHNYDRFYTCLTPCLCLVIVDFPKFVCSNFIYLGVIRVAESESIVRFSTGSSHILTTMIDFRRAWHHVYA